MRRSYLSIKNHTGAGVKSGILLLSAMLAFVTIACTNSQASAGDEDLTKYVDPYIGTDYHGHVFIGANVPFGAVQPGPTNYVKGWDWCSGYHYSDSIMTGFSQLHLSGTGIGDLGDVLITPYTGKRHFSPGNQENPLSGYASMYTHDRENPEAGYYGVDLLDYDIKAEMTASKRVALHRYTFPESEEARIAINLQMGIGWDSPVKTKLEKVNDTTFVGFRHSTGWAEDQRLFFAIVTSRSFDDVAIQSGDDISETSAEGRAVVGVLTGSTKADEQVQLKVGISPVSHENALQNIEKEMPHWDFKQVREDARKKWNRELSKIKISHSDESVKRTFYTSMYHSFIAPVLFNDHDGSYRGTDKKVYDDPGFENYSIFSLWDTYRAIHPLFTIVQTNKVDDMVNSMLTIYEQQGKLPIWHLMGNETNTMVGYSAVPVVTDAVFKGFDGFDHDLAWEAVLESSNVDSDGIDHLKEMGYIPADKEIESVSKALEYAISDWAIARFAEMRGDEKNAEKYHERSRVYEKYFDSETRFMRPLMSDGSFKEPFDPFQSIHEEGDYTEGNAWQYTWLVPHDVEGLIDLMGGEEAFEEKFDRFFEATGEMGEKASPDISGLIGQYAQGNEPSHHAAYLYNYSGSQWKTAEKTRYIMDKFYTDQPDGLPGNEDCGQMSAWYVFSSIGFYPVNPASSVFAIGSPEVEKATIQVEGDKTFTVVAENNSDKNIYIQSAQLNGQDISRSYITYNEIMQGGKLKLVMGDTPNEEFGAAPENRPIEELPQK